jgi:hypothetical protein
MDEKQTYFSNHSLERQSINEQDRFSSSISDHQQLIYNQNILPISTASRRKRTIQDDYSIQEPSQQVRERENGFKIDIDWNFCVLDE